MYTGHVAIALAARGVRRDLPLWVAVVASQAPDWVEVICANLGAGATAQLWSHAFPFVVLGAAVAAIIVRLRTRSPRAALVTFVVYLSHPLADLVTGHKPLWLGGPPIGLWFIERPVADFVVQSAFCVIGWVIYRKSLPPHVRGRLIAVAPLVTLLALQGVSDLVVLVRKPFRTAITAGDGRRRTGNREPGTGNREPGTEALYPDDGDSSTRCRSLGMTRLFSVARRPSPVPGSRQSPVARPRLYRATTGNVTYDGCAASCTSR